MRKTLLLTIACALALATLNAQPLPNKPEPTSPVTGSAAIGKKLFYSYGCYACHGYNGETGYRAFVGNWGHLANEQEFITFLRQRVNVAPVVPSDRMPNFSPNVMSDKQAKDIYAYIRTFKSSAPPLKDIPTLNAIVAAAKREKN
ncbi:MAG TPA: cytochrome c [Bryobacteraceae bacterium]|nr:cytochrome c [Bryobacteraceae bacterium]